MGFPSQKGEHAVVFCRGAICTLATFYANLFAKVFCYLQENDPAQEWVAVAVFRSRSVEPEKRTPYEDLIQSHRVRRIYLDELALPADPPVGLGILQLVTAPVERPRISSHGLYTKQNTKLPMRKWEPKCYNW